MSQGLTFELFKISGAPPALTRARARALTTRIPLLYLILVINMLLLASAYQGAASTLSTICAPGLLSAICIWRGGRWLAARHGQASLEAMVRKQRQTAILATLFSILFLAWALHLYPYGDAMQKAHVTFFIAITVISCILCLIHLPAAAFGVTMVVTAPFSFYLLWAGDDGAALIAANMLIIISVLVYVLIAYTNDFSLLIATQAALDAKQAETQRLSDDNLRLANVDSLTGLANRRAFFSDLQEVVAARGQEGRAFVFGLIDLDGFKPVNDTHGHLAGDDVLREVGARLTAMAGNGLRFARLGGDEFAVLADRDLDEAGVVELGRRLCARLSVPYLIGDMTIGLTGTCGFVRFPDAGATVEMLYEKADYALYRAKNAQRGSVQIFSPNMQKQYQNAKLVEQMLARADLEAELFMEFQPIIDVESRRVVALEALARWSNPHLGRVAPDMFIAAAERSILIHRVTATLLRKALEAAKSWPGEQHLSFNLSVRDLISREAITHIVALIESSGFPPHRLILEITETALMRDYELAQESLTLLKRLGAQIALDDFGTGYSSLSYVHRLPLDRLKIDRSFVRGLSQSSSSRDVIRTILQLCDNLKLSCVAEGIETEEEADLLRSLGCTTMQGYLFAKPLGAAEAGAFISSANDAARRAA